MRAPSVASRSSSRGQSPRDDRMVDSGLCFDFYLFSIIQTRSKKSNIQGTVTSTAGIIQHATFAWPLPVLATWIKGFAPCAGCHAQSIALWQMRHVRAA